MFPVYIDNFARMDLFLKCLSVLVNVDTWCHPHFLTNEKVHAVSPLSIKEYLAKMQSQQDAANEAAAKDDNNADKGE